MKIISVCLITILLLFFIPGKIFAHATYNFQAESEGQINEALLKIVPVRFLISNPLYFGITFKESVTRFFQPSALKKAEFDMILAGKKLKEVYLLIERGDVKNASRMLRIYSDRVDKMSHQLEKARSQNQEVSTVVDLVAENLRVHETLFFAINKKWQFMEDSYSFDANFAQAVSSHARAVMVINNVRPGLKDRFSTVKSEATDEAKPSPNSSGDALFEASPSTRPKRVIF